MTMQIKATNDENFSKQYNKLSVLDSVRNASLQNGENYIGWKENNNDSDKIIEHYLAKSGNNGYDIHMQVSKNNDGETNVLIDKEFDGIFDALYKEYNDSNDNFAFYTKDLDIDGNPETIDDSLDGWSTVSNPEYLSELYASKEQE